MYIAIQTIYFAIYEGLLGYVQMNLCHCLAADHCRQKALSKDGRLHRFEGSRAASL